MAVEGGVSRIIAGAKDNRMQEVATKVVDRVEQAPVRASVPDDIAIRVENLGKRYKLYEDPWARAAEWVTGGRVKRHKDFWAVRGVSFEVARGECMGIIGANGAGKSTLLKLITGSLHPTEGSCQVNGRLLSLIELGTGLNPDLTGRENVFYVTRLLAFPAGYAKERMDDIAAFADIGEFFDRPIRLYSSGMKARLNFAMFANLQPDVLIVDEVLSVGDVFFRQRCATRMKQMLDNGLTMLFVSHDQGAVEHLCTQGMLLKHGVPVFLGAPDEAIAKYHEDLRAPARQQWRRERAASEPAVRAETKRTTEEAFASSNLMLDARGERGGTGAMRLQGVRVTDSAGRDTKATTIGSNLVFHLLIEAHQDVECPTAGVLIYDRFNTLVYGGGTNTVNHPLPPMRGGDRMVVRLEIRMGVRAGQYSFHAGVSEPLAGEGDTSIQHDMVAGMGPIHVHAPEDGRRRFYGQAELPLTATHVLLS